MDRNTRLGCLVVVFGSLALWIIIILAVIGAITTYKAVF